jgi:hypothetical protein
MVMLSTALSTVLMVALALLAHTCLSQAAVPVTSTLWTSGSGFPCYRQPVVIAADSAGSTILAFVEGRYSTPCAPAFDADAAVSSGGADSVDAPREVGGLNLRISNDGGLTWGPSNIIYGNATREGRCHF